MFLRASWRNLPHPNKSTLYVLTAAYVSPRPRRLCLFLAPSTSAGDHVDTWLRVTTNHEHHCVSLTYASPPISRSFIRFLRLRFAADYVEFHEVRRAANTHRGAGHDADDVAFAHQLFFQQALFRNGRQAVNFVRIFNFRGHHTPDQ